MGSHQKTTQNTNQQTTGNITETPTIPNAVLGQWNNALGGFQGLMGSPVFSSSASPLVGSMLGNALATIKGQNAASQQQAAQNLGIRGTGDNSALLATLARTGAITSAGAANATIPQALQAQTNMDLSGRQLQGGEYGNLLQAINSMAGQQRSVNQQQQGTNLINTNSYTSKGFGG